MSEHDETNVELPRRGISSSHECLTHRVAAAASGITLIFALAGCATPPNSSSSGVEREASSSAGMEASGQGGARKLGIRMEALRLSASGYMLDLRYRLIDPIKAAPLLDRKIRPYLLDEASGAQLAVPDTAKLGQLRTAGRNKVVPGQNYFILFANPGRFVQAGSKMTLVMGDLRIENLIVE